MENVIKLSYGLLMPFICFFGVLGHVVILMVLNGKNFKPNGTVYVFMLGSYAIRQDVVENVNSYVYFHVTC